MTDEDFFKRKMATLRKAAEDSLAAIPKEDWHAQGAVNWGDIGVREVRYWLNDQGETGYTISLEEAAPGSKLCQTIYEEMGAPENVEIVCEW